jgi:hypothetical protein
MLDLQQSLLPAEEYPGTVTDFHWRCRHEWNEAERPAS